MRETNEPLVYAFPRGFFFIPSWRPRKIRIRRTENGILVAIGRKIRKKMEGEVFEFVDISRDIPHAKLTGFNEEETIEGI